MRSLMIGWLSVSLMTFALAQVTMSPEVGDLIQQGNRARQLQQSQSALSQYQQAVERARVLGDRAGEAGALYALGVAYIDLSQPHQAVPHLQRALTLWQALQDPKSEAQTWHSLGVAYTNWGKPQEALEAYQNALRLHRSLGHRHAEAQTLQGIGLVYYALYDITNATTFIQQALTIWNELDNKPQQAESLRYLGNLFYATGQWQNALSTYQKALELCRDLPDPQIETPILAGLATLYVSLNQPELALNYYLQALELRLKDPLRKEVVVTYLGVGNLYRLMNQSARARDYIQRALELSRTLSYPRGEIAALTALAQLDTQQDASEAEKLYHQALTLARTHNDRQSQANILANLGLLYARTERTETALSTLQSALNLYAELSDLRGEMYALSNLGTLYLNLGERTKALEHYARAIERAERLREQTNPFTEGRLSFQAQRQALYTTYLSLLVKEKRFEEAFNFAQRVKARTLNDMLRLGRVTTSNLLTAEERAEERALRFRLDRASQNLLAVRAVANPEIAEEKALIDQLGQEARQAEVALQAFYDRIYARYPTLAQHSGTQIATLQEVAQNLPPDTVLLEYVYTGPTKPRGSALLLFCISNNQGKPQLTVYPLFTEQPLAELTESFVLTCAQPTGNYERWARTLYRALIAPAEAELVGKRTLIICPDVELWDVPFQALLNVQGFLGEQFALSYAPSATIAQSIRARMLETNRPRPSENVLVVAHPDYGVKGLMHLAWMRPLTAGSRPLVTGSRLISKQTRLLTKGARPLLAGARPLLAGARPLTVGARPLLVGARPITAGARPLLVGARPITAGARPLTIGARPLIAGARPITAGARPITAGARPLTVGARGIEGGSIVGNTYAVSPLPYTAEEAQAIQRLFPDTTILQGRKAQEATLKAVMGNYRYVHLATHGYFSPVTPLQSALLLAEPDPESHEDGLLTARELLEIVLSAEMVVLSACESGRGAARPGEGVIGIIWALSASGVPTQVLSQWKVNDRSTALLMAEFYRALKQGKTPAEALQEASVSLKQMPEYQHPYYWAPFICVGGLH